MADTLHLSASDRVLVLAPHPDDESIACGGLLLAARAAGATRRVVVLTDGDNNPWPQRWVEKRWRIDAAARARWGARRRAEAQAALDVLGVEAGERVFFGWPDMGLTTMLMHEPSRVAQALAEQLDAFRPTHLALPALTDKHPDHSAAHVAVRFALARAADPTVHCLFYSVHGEKVDVGYVVELDPRQREQKRQAILQHKTQMAFSSKRFLRFATAHENYRSGEAAQARREDLPLSASIGERGEIELALDTRRVRALRSLHLLLAIDADDGSTLRWRIPLAAETSMEVSDLVGGRAVAEISWLRDGAHLRVRLTPSFSAPLRLSFCKLAQTRAELVVYDRYGWQFASRKPL